MIRRIAFAAVFAAVALSATGCCGTFRNLVYRIRSCHDCYPAYGAGGSYYGSAGVVSPSYSAPILDAGPIMGSSVPGCSSCSSNAAMPYTSAGAGVPMVPYAAAGAGVPGVPSYSMQPTTGYPAMAGHPVAGGPVAGIK